jgi:hypothetical protein
MASDGVNFFGTANAGKSATILGEIQDIVNNNKTESNINKLS